MNIETTSINWAIDFIAKHSDGDLFPRIPEIEAIVTLRDYFSNILKSTPLSQCGHGISRRFIIPKDDLAYRQATQLAPQDSIILTAIIHQLGQGIENRRLGKDTIFSYRFSPTTEDGLYSMRDAWSGFWKSALFHAERYKLAVYCDISDFYNQIYHHTIENQLVESSFPNQATKWIISLLESTTAGVSRGVPIGPHAIHLIAEATLIPIDNSLQSKGLKFIRYADDIIIFTQSESEASSALFMLATSLDKQQRLTLQRQKTKIYKQDEMIAHCKGMLSDKPIEANESQLIRIIKKHSGGNPYASILHSQISADDLALISNKSISEIITNYINQKPPDYIRLRWFYRRLAQIGHPGAISPSLESIDALIPCFPQICFYLGAVQTMSNEEWIKVGDKMLLLINHELVKDNEYYKQAIISLFGRNEKINHLTKLTAMYAGSAASIRREILLAARINKAHDWIREHKESYLEMDSWTKSAFIYCCRNLPLDERKYFIGRNSFSGVFEETLAKWCKQKDLPITSATAPILTQ